MQLSKYSLGHWTLEFERINKLELGSKLSDKFEDYLFQKMVGPKQKPIRIGGTDVYEVSGTPEDYLSDMLTEFFDLKELVDKLLDNKAEQEALIKAETDIIEQLQEYI